MIKVKKDIMLFILILIQLVINWSNSSTINDKGDQSVPLSQKKSDPLTVNQMIELRNITHQLWSDYYHDNGASPDLDTEVDEWIESLTESETHYYYHLLRDQATLSNGEYYNYKQQQPQMKDMLEMYLHDIVHNKWLNVDQDAHANNTSVVHETARRMLKYYQDFSSINHDQFDEFDDNEIQDFSKWIQSLNDDQWEYYYRLMEEEIVVTTAAVVTAVTLVTGIVAAMPAAVQELRKLIENVGVSIGVLNALEKTSNSAGYNLQWYGEKVIAGGISKETGVKDIKPMQSGAVGSFNGGANNMLSSTMYGYRSEGIQRYRFQPAGSKLIGSNKHYCVDIMWHQYERVGVLNKESTGGGFGIALIPDCRGIAYADKDLYTKKKCRDMVGQLLQNEFEFYSDIPHWKGTTMKYMENGKWKMRHTTPDWRYFGKWVDRSYSGYKVIHDGKIAVKAQMDDANKAGIYVSVHRCGKGKNQIKCKKEFSEENVMKPLNGNLVKPLSEWELNAFKGPMSCAGRR